jgi:hypothetical protein
VFLSIVVNIKASKKSTAGYSQFRALQQSNLAVELDTSTKRQVIVQFRIRSTSFISTTNVYTLIGKVQFYIVNANTPFLLYFVNIDKL